MWDKGCGIKDEGCGIKDEGAKIYQMFLKCIFVQQERKFNI